MLRSTWTQGFLDQAGTVISDLACRRCGYNLRGLNNQGRCPECGAAIGLSCHGDLLRFADPKWVETLGRGASLILWGVLASVCWRWSLRRAGDCLGRPDAGDLGGTSR